MFVAIGIEITFFGCGLCILQALERIPESGKGNVPGMLFYLFNAVIMLGVALIARGIPQEYPASIFLFLTSLVIIGPLNLFYYHTLLYPETPLPYRVTLHLAPAMACFIAEVLFQFQPLPIKKEMIAGFLGDPLNSPLFFLLAAVVTHILVYIAAIIKVALSDVGISGSLRGFRFILYIAICILLVIAFLFGGFVGQEPAVFIAGGIINVWVHISLYIGIRAYPQFFFELKREIKKKRYEKSMLRGLDTDIIRDRLDELMAEEGLFRDSDISLAAVAERLTMTPHQLSQMLNERMNTGFWDFVNRYRIEEAKRLLRDNPDANIISVCFRVGFNSKSSFNSAFKKMTGMTPREFKQGGA
ncbi:MAG TPA: helix-turn-helix transcriptional regulator [Spirochaetota bacterium]|nr:helix-turn-helix transcriptional regulator [Spirochaetota bacterium]HPV39596.1 helix-turn-helix transcriptional regulator [Spirochaetota bacterium]